MSSSLSKEIARFLDVDSASADEQIEELVHQIQQQVDAHGEATIEGLGVITFRNGALRFDPDPSLSMLINREYAGLVPVVLDPTDIKPGFRSTKPVSKPVVEEKTETPPVPTFTIPEQAVEEPEQALDEPEAVVGEPEQTIGEPEQTLEDSEIVEEPEQVLDVPEADLEEPEQALESEMEAWEDAEDTTEGELPESDFELPPIPDERDEVESSLFEPEDSDDSSIVAEERPELTEQPEQSELPSIDSLPSYEDLKGRQEGVEQVDLGEEQDLGEEFPSPVGEEEEGEQPALFEGEDIEDEFESVLEAFETTNEDDDFDTTLDFDIEDEDAPRIDIEEAFDQVEEIDKEKAFEEMVANLSELWSVQEGDTEDEPVDLEAIAYDEEDEDQQSFDLDLEDTTTAPVAGPVPDEEDDPDSEETEIPVMGDSIAGMWTPTSEHPEAGIEEIEAEDDEAFSLDSLTGWEVGADQDKDDKDAADIFEIDEDETDEVDSTEEATQSEFIPPPLDLSADEPEQVVAETADPAQLEYARNYKPTFSFADPEDESKSVSQKHPVRKSSYYRSNNNLAIIIGIVATVVVLVGLIWGVTWLINQSNEETGGIETPGEVVQPDIESPDVDGEAPVAGEDPADQPLQEASPAVEAPQPGDWVWVVASEITRGAAETVVARLAQEGYPASIVEGLTGTGQTRYRVTIGRFSSREQTLQNRSVLPPGSNDAWVTQVE